MTFFNRAGRGWFSALLILAGWAGVAQTDIVRMEYYLDTDPGIGQGSAIPLTADTDVTVDFTLSLTGVSQGIHLMSLRAQDANGTWSQTNHQVFFVIRDVEVQDLIAAEYYLDTDPGFGQGTVLSFTPSDSVLLESNLDLSGLAPGIHQLGVRAMNRFGNWSQSNLQTFFVIGSPAIPDLVAAEYYFDEDPGFGMGLPINVVASDSLLLTPSLDLTGLNPGIHQLHIRVQNATGNWSHSNTAVLFAVVAQEVASIDYLEYYFNEDPGFGLGISIEISPGDSIMINETIDLSSFAEGEILQFAIRARDSNGSWSASFSQEIIVANLEEQVISFTMIAAKTYGDDTFTLEATSDSGLPVTFSSSDESVLSIIGDQATILAAGDVTVTAAQDGDTEFKPAASVDQSLEIAKAALTIQADDQTKAYGESNPGLTVSYTGFVNSEDEHVLETLPSLSTTAIEDSDAGTYNITLSGTSALNYSIAEVPGVLTISKAPLSITALDASRIYGAANPSFELIYEGFVLGQNELVLDNATQFNTEATVASDVGLYSIIPVTGEDNNYSITDIAGELLITKTTLSTVLSDQSRVYGQSNDKLEFTYEGFVNGDDATVIDTTPTVSTDATESSDVGVYAMHLVGGEDNNYEILVSVEPAMLTVTKAELIASADDQTKVYGEQNPELTINYVGFVLTDEPEVLDTAPLASTDADESSGVGDYPITLSAGLDNNYAITSENGRLTVAQAALRAVAEDVSRTYGDENPAFGIFYSGFVNNDTEAVINVPPVATTTAGITSNVGTYAIELSEGSDDNYMISVSNGTLTVEQTELVVTAADESRTYGAANPVFAVQYEGFVNGEDESVLDVLPTPSTAADETSDVGEYSIEISGGNDLNYAISRSSGTLTIEKAPLTVTVDDVTIVEGEQIPSFTFSFEGFLNGDEEADIAPPDANTSATSTSDPGEYPIELSNGDAFNYVLTLVNGVLTIEARPLGLTEDVNLMVYPNPVTDRLMLNAGNLQIERLELYNMNGQLIRQLSPSQNEYDLVNLPNGIYSLFIFSKGKKSIVRLIKN